MELPVEEVWWTPSSSNGSLAATESSNDNSSNPGKPGKHDFESTVGDSVGQSKIRLPFVPHLDLREACPSSSVRVLAVAEPNHEHPGPQGTAATCSSKSARKKHSHKKNLTEEQRIQRNVREQERSNQLSQQFEVLRNLLLEGGLVVPRGTKSVVLSVCMDYIQALRQQEIQMQR
jgi:Helix-loop-helix DNA-binding domain